DGKEDVKDEPRSGRPPTSTIPDNIERVRRMLSDDRRLSLRKIAEELKISLDSMSNIIHEHLQKLSDCRDRPGRFPAYHSCAEWTFQAEFALALWIENISDAKSSPEASEGRALPSFASKSATSLPKSPAWEGIH
ncbi:hypothetical protein AVEN_267992-2-1, partial [Araneus ventricosus]